MKPVTHVRFDHPLKFIVVSYFPGSFGSILYHSLNSAPEIGNDQREEIFVPEHGGAHKVTDEIFDRHRGEPHGVMHDGEEVDPWIAADDAYREQYILDNINYDKIKLLKELNPRREYYMHRWVVPNAEHLVARHLRSKIVGVILDDDVDLDITVGMHVKKSLLSNMDTNIIPKLQKNNPYMAKVFQKLNEDQRRDYLVKVSRDRMAKISGQRCYDVGIHLKDFLARDRYLTRIQEIARFLDINPDYDHVAKIYTLFHKINNIDRICHDYGI